MSGLVKSPAPPPVRRIVVRGVNWLGDAVMTTPALVRLRAAFPDAHISLLTPEKLGDLWLHHPVVDAVAQIRPEESVWRVARQLRRESFELGIVFPNSPRTALELWLAGVPRRIGHAAPWRRWLLTHSVPTRPGHVAMRKRSSREVRALLQSGRASVASAPQPLAHHVHHYLNLVATVGADPTPLPPQLTVTDRELEAVAQRFGLERTGDVASPWLGLNAGAEYGPAKRWPRESFVAAARALQLQTGCRWLILGGRQDVDLATAIARDLAPAPADRFVEPTNASPSAVVNLAGRTTLRELCAVLKLCRVVLTNDTGPMHVAAAVGTPVVVPFGSTSPDLTGPGLPNDPRHHLLTSDVPCRPCFLRECPVDLRCLKSITIERVVAAVRAALVP